MSTSNGSIGAASYTRAIKRTPPSLIVGSKYPPEKVKKVKKMNWFKRKFAQWTREAWENARKEEVYATETVHARESISGKSSIRFTVYAAQGGNIIEYYKQDRYRESDGPELVLVTGDQTIGQAVEHILTMEALKS